MGRARPTWFLVVLLGFVALVPRPTSAATITFRDVTKSSGIRFQFKTDLRHGRMISTMGGGVAAADYDGDGWTDLFFTGSASDAFKPEKGPCGALYRNRGDGTFEDATAKSGIRACGWQMAATWVDIDSDGLPDLIVGGLDQTTVWQNRGDGTFREVSGQRGLSLGHHFTIGAAAGDIDGDGRVDLFFVGYLETSLSHELSFPLFQIRMPEDYAGEDARLFCQRPDGSFEDATVSAGVSNHDGKGTGAVFFDYDGDGRQDLFVANDRVSNRLFRNLGGGKFEDVTEQTGAGSREARAKAGMGIAVGDPFLSGHPSVYVTNFSGETNTLYQSVEGELFEDATEKSNAGAASWPLVQWGTGFADFDDDGNPDLYAVSGHIGYHILAVLSRLFGYGMKENVWQGDRSHRQPMTLWRNAGAGKFEDAASSSGAFGKLRLCARGSATADLDGDGRVDLAVAAISGGSRVLRNTTASPDHALEILPVAGADRRTALGTKVRVVAGGKVQIQEFIVVPSYASGSWVPLHFGLGSSASADRVEVFAPGATRPTAVFRDVAGGRLYRLRDGALAEVRTFRR
ncbi:MAG: CRTAC1 family protein [Thermoanaerobaculia bacterium]